MNDAIKKIKKHRGATIAITAFLVAFVAFSVVRCSAVHSGDGDPDSASSEQSSANSSSDSSSASSSDNSDKPTEDSVEITDEQQKIIDGYGTDEKTLIALLEANTWTNNDETKILSFEDDSFTQRSASSNKEATESFAICSLDETTQAQTQNSRGTVKVTSITALLEDGSYVQAKLTTTTLADFSETTLSLSGDMFDTTYTRKAAAQTFDLVGMEDITDNTLPSTPAKIKETLQDYCSIYYPTATEATWTKEATEDYTTNTVTLSFTLNNQSKSSVSIGMKKDGSNPFIITKRS